MEMVDLFCGGGGSSTGFHQAGFTTKFAVDRAWHARETFKLNHGDVAYDYDVSKLRAEPILDKLNQNRPTLVTASPPCEPFTTANKKRVDNPFTRLFDDKTGRLMIHAIRLISDLEPEFWMIENVRGILDGENRGLLEDEIIDMGLGDPYFNWIEAEQWGVPSHRTRVIISNVELKTPKTSYYTVRDVIGDLPDPNYPHGLENHYYVPVSSKYESDMITQHPGHGLVFFYGHNQDFQNYIRLHMDKPAPVVMGKSRFVHPFYDRILTPFEHGRLMTFPDDYKYTGTTDQVYDVIGEAVPPKVTHEIGKQMMELI